MGRKDWEGQDNWISSEERRQSYENTDWEEEARKREERANEDPYEPKRKSERGYIK